MSLAVVSSVNWKNRCSMLARQSARSFRHSPRLFALSAAVSDFFSSMRFRETLYEVVENRLHVGRSTLASRNALHLVNIRLRHVSRCGVHVRAGPLQQIANWFLLAIVRSPVDSAWVKPRCAKQCRRSSSIIYRLYGCAGVNGRAKSGGGDAGNGAVGNGAYSPKKRISRCPILFARVCMCMRGMKAAVFIEILRGCLF
jgi:hypothetical protein